MSGNNLLVDTNIIIYTLGGRGELAERTKGCTLFLSVISEIEAFCYKGLTEKGKQMVKAYVSRCTIIGIEDRVKFEAIRLRSDHKLKLPDAIIAAMAVAFDLILLTADRTFERVKNELALEQFQV